MTGKSKKTLHLLALVCSFWIIPFTSLTLNAQSLENALLKSERLGKRGEHALALAALDSALSQAESTDNPELYGKTLLQKATCHHVLNEFDGALKALYDARLLFETADAIELLARTNNHIGALHHHLKDFEKALNYYEKAYQLYLSSENRNDLAQLLNNLGTLEQDRGKPHNALEYHRKSLKIWQSKGQKGWEALTFMHLGQSFEMLGKLDSAVYYLEQSLEYYLVSNQPRISSRLFCRYGNLLRQLNRYSQADDWCEKGLGLAEESDELQGQQNCCECLYLLREEAGNSRDALHYFKRYTRLQDSIFSEQKLEEIMRIEMSYVYRQQQLADSILYAKQIAVEKSEVARRDAELRAQRNQQYGLAGGLFLALVFSALILGRYRVTRRQKNIIQKQKSLVDEKNQAVTESIIYARRLQRAILPSVKFFKQHLPASFVVYRPKDIVAGDFFWAQKMDDTVLFAVADATGHGIPAAMVSVVCCNALNEVSRENNFDNPARILDAVREKVAETFGGGEQQMSEGMDISLCALNGMHLRWAGANRPLWIIRNGELIELKGDRQAVGEGVFSDAFTLQEMTLLPGDRLYLFSDGFTDQFGGPDNKKFKSAYFKGMLLEIQSNPLSEQQNIIQSAFDEWKGTRPQLDDVCVVGVEV